MIVVNDNTPIDLVTLDDPNSVKNEFLSHFKERFDRPCSSRLILDMTYPNRLNLDQIDDLERNVTKEEIKRAVWDCGTDKSPGPDGFTFGFYRRYWDIMEKDVVDAVSFFFTEGMFPKGRNASFIALIPKMQDAKVVKDFRPISLIGSLYKIIAKILANRLVMVLGDLVSEVQSAFIANRQILDGSILVIESPTDEFHFRRGLKQDEGLFKGVSVGSSLQLSHLFYADDVIFMGQWSESNIITIVHALDCFHKASGLRMNLQKSKLLGILLRDEKVSISRMKMVMLNVEDSLYLIMTLSIGGRLTLLKSVLGSTPIYYMSMFKVPSQVLKCLEDIRRQFFNGADPKEKKMSWVKWSRVLASKDKGGLGVSSFFALNRALLLKWVWRFRYDRNSLWTRFIKALYGNSGSIETPSKVAYSSTWLNIVTEFSMLKNQGMDLLSFMKKKVGDGQDTFFWEEVWMGDMTFKSRFPRVYALESDKKITVADKMNHNVLGFSLRRAPRDGVEMEQFRDMIAILEGVELPAMHDRWIWSLVGSGEFSVASARKFIDDHRLTGSPHKTRWVKVVPIKINVMAWKVRFDFLPTRLNLSRRGLELQSILCPNCNKEVESTSHIFFACSMVRDLYRKIASWWELSYSEFDSYDDWLDWFQVLRLHSKHRDMLEGVDFAAGGGPTAVVDPVTDVENLAPDTVIPAKPKRFRKKRPAVADASGSSHPPKKLREDHGTSIGAATGGKSPSSIQELLARSILNAEIGVAAVATLHFTKAVDAEVDFVIRSASSPPVMTRVVITTSVLSAPSIPASGATSKVTPQAQPSIFHDSSSVGTIRPYVAGSSHRPGKELSMGSQEINSESFHEVFIPRWNMPNDTLLDDHDTSREFIDHLAPLVLFVQIREMDYHHLFTEFNIGTARQACLNTKVRMQTKYCLSERTRLESECEKQVGLLKARDEEIESLKAQLSLKEAEATEVVRLRAQVAIVEATEKVHADELDALKQKNVALEDEKDSLNRKIADLQSSISTKDLELKDFNSTVTSLKSQNDILVDQVHALETTCSGLCDQVSGYEHLKEQIEEFKDTQMNVVNDKVAKLEVDLIEMALHLEEKFCPHLLTTISGRRWLLTHGIKLVVVKCLNSPEYLTALGTAISCAFEKGMQDGLSAGIDHGREGRSLADVVAYNPSVEEDYNSALRELHAVDFPLLAERKSQKDASVETIMNLIRLEGPLADSLRMSDLQLDVDQLMLPIHRSKDQVVLGVTSLSFALSVAHSRVEKIRQNIAEKRSALADVWVPLVDPLSIQNLIGAAGTSDSVPTAAATTTALLNVVISTSSAPSITIDDYEVIGVDGQEDA
ncbi:RNA-directed DNA polymerase, eukaryota, reverse transcriptase zinc-binding domain protein [Tanacetum coccineum]